MSALQELWPWIAFHALLFLVLGTELYVSRGGERVTLHRAVAWTSTWVALALAWGGLIFVRSGSGPALEYLTGYVVELSLSVDNVFVFVLIFSYFRVPREYRYRALLWGVLGALVMRGVLITAGTLLIAEFEWILYVFGAFLVVTGVRLALDRGHEVEPAQNPVLRLLRRRIRITDHYHGQRFVVHTARGWAATPLLVVLVAIETTDVVFALDSIPAIFGITREPFIVYTSNILAVACLRSLYFVLEAAVERFRYLNYGLAVILVFIGVKLLLEDVVHIPIGLSLGLVLGILGGSVLISLRGRRAEDGPSGGPGP